jgi:hypothetical protein
MRPIPVLQQVGDRRELVEADTEPLGSEDLQEGVERDGGVGTHVR